jgi:hypothetical protein
MAEPAKSAGVIALSSGLPSAPRRFARRRLSVAALVAATLFSVLAGLVRQSAAGRLTAEIDAHWRGAYDILVQPPVAVAGVDQTDGLVEPNFIALNRAGGMSVDEWHAIQALSGVAVAAPISWIGSMKSSTGTPTIEITKFPSRPTLYEATLTVSVSDGLTDHLVDTFQQHVLLGAAPASGGEPLALTDGGDVLLGSLEDGSPVADVGTAVAPPEVQSPILAVDPESERQLLGSSGAFLDPLVSLRARDGLTTLTADARLVMPGYSQRLDISILARRKIVRPVIPVLVSESTFAQVKLNLDVVTMGHPVDGSVDASRGSAAVTDALAHVGGGRIALGTASADVTKGMRAFRLNPLAVAWPGTNLTDAGVGTQVRGAPAFTASVYGRPTYAVTSAPGAISGPSFLVEPKGTVGPGGPTAPQPSGPAIQVGAEQAYRQVIELPIPIAPPGSGDLSFAPFIFAPIAEYDLASVELPKDPLDYVPFGAYDRPDTTLFADPSGQAVSPMPMAPTLNPAGLIGVPPMGIVDMAAAGLLRGDRPIDAIRVRLAGITDYGPNSLQRITDVAASIHAMGLSATVVAASSPQAVNLFVPAYDLADTSPRDLGWVRQHWTTVGATPMVEQALSSATLALLALAMLTVAVVVIGSELVAASGRRREADVLAAVGWHRSRIRRWQVSESLSAAAVVVAAGVTASALSGGDRLGLAVMLLAATLFVIGGAVGAVIAASKPGARPSARNFGFAGLSTSLLTMSLRLAFLNRARTMVTAAGVAIAAATVALSGGVLLTLGTKVGPTLLGSAVLSSLGPFQVALLALALASSVSFTVIALRMERRARVAEARVLAACGWQRRDVARLFLIGRAIIALLAAVLAVPLAAVAAAALIGELAAAMPAATAAGLLALSVIVWGGIGATQSP